MTDVALENELGSLNTADGAPTSVNSTGLTGTAITTSQLVTRAQLARMAGVTRGAVTQACGGRLAAACSGRLVDTAHPAVVGWLAGPHPSPTAGVSPEQRAERHRRALRRLQVLPDSELAPLVDDVLGLVRRLLAGPSADRLRDALPGPKP